MAQDELRNKSTGIIHNELIVQWEDKWQLRFESIGQLISAVYMEV